MSDEHADLLREGKRLEQQCQQALLLIEQGDSSPIMSLTMNLPTLSTITNDLGKIMHQTDDPLLARCVCHVGQYANLDFVNRTHFTERSKILSPLVNRSKMLANELC